MAIVDGEELILDTGKRITIDFGVVGIGHGLCALPHGFLDPDQFSESELPSFSLLMIERWSALQFQFVC